MFWSDEDLLNLVKEKYPQYLKLYNGFKYNIQRVDFARILILHQYGGVYVDLDYQPLKPLDYLFRKKSRNIGVYLSNTPGYKIKTNSILAGKKGDKFWEHLLQTIERRHNNPKFYIIGKYLTVMNSGPLAVTDAFESYSKKKRIEIFPNNLLRCGPCENVPCLRKGDYLMRLEGGSWHNSEVTIISLICCHWPIIVVFTVLFVVVIILWCLGWL